MEVEDQIQIISFYEFKDMINVGELAGLKAELRAALVDFEVRGTIVIAAEGYNGMVCGRPEHISDFVARIQEILQAVLVYRSSFHTAAPFRKIDVKIKPEIVTLKKPVDMSLGSGTHIKPCEWNSIISDPETLLLDARNDYEYQTGTFRGAINPKIAKFSELPSFVSEHLDPSRHKRVAMFCTGGIRCEKFVPYMKQMGFDEVYQLEGGILKYLEEIPVGELLWDGECFVFDERTTVKENLAKGSGPDRSQRRANAKKSPYKVSK